MKATLCSLAALFILLQDLYTQIDTTGFPPLLARYTFDGHTRDVSGHEMHGRKKNGIYVIDRHGKPECALELIGDGQFFAMPEVADLRTPGWSYSLWFMIYDHPSRVTGSSGSDFFLLTYKDIVFGDDVHFYIDDEGDDLSSFYTFDYEKMGADQVLEPGRWYFAAIVYDTESNVTVYMDGTEEFSYHSPFTSHTSDSLLVSSNCALSPEKGRMRGRIDDVHFYGGVLTAEQVKELSFKDYIISLEECEHEVFPAPMITDDIIRIRSNCPVDDTYMYSMDGKLVFYSKGVPREGIPTSHLSAAPYVLISNAADRVYYNKLLVIR